MSIDRECAIGRIGIKGLIREGMRLGITKDETETVVMTVLNELPTAFEAAREQVRDIPGALAMADTMVTNLRALSPLHQESGVGFSAG